MPIQVTSDNIKLSSSMEELAVNKLATLKKLFPETPDENFYARVVMNSGQEEDTFVVKIELDVGKIHVSSKESGFSMENALVGAIDDASRQIKKEKTKYEAHWEENRELKRFKTPQEDQ